ncbi:FMN-binding protein [Sulfurimonas lithotrophica]|uniref:FMN-binding protein n=1 Tax=Sulfurimonas lithotrophica TaxID=2590022 RepID=A0A5P8P2Q1_9BACT|nr:FMN-binding protein [Sulfurimonas lithotrophica]QFR50008.1 FMN-binding protein [Sulfurimonas lithotrophica]
MKIILLITILSIFIDAKVLTSIDEAMNATFGEDCKISKKTILLKNNEFKKVQKIAKTKIKSKIFQVYFAKKDSKTIGYGVLISKKIRSKNGVVLYMIDVNGTLKEIEIIAFNEPLDYLPSKKWKNEFINTPNSKLLEVGKNIPTITGATLSAKSITNSARVALALYDIKLKEF